MARKRNFEQDRYFDPQLGEFEVTAEEIGKFCGMRTVWRNWMSCCHVGGQVQPITLSLSGRESGPHAALLEAVRLVFANLPAITARALTELARRGSTAAPADFRISRVSDWDEHDNVLAVEYLPARPGLLDSDFEFYWPGDDWMLDHHIVFRAIDHTILWR